MALDLRRAHFTQPNGVSRALESILRDQVLLATNFPSAQAALTQGAGSKRAVFFSRGTWAVTTPLINTGCRVIGEPGTRFVKTGPGQCFYTPATIPTGNNRRLTADAAIGSRTLALSSVAGLAAGQTVILAQQGIVPDWPEGPDAFAEYVHIEAITGNTVTLTTPLAFAYTASVRPLGTIGAEVMTATLTQGVGYEGIEIVMDLAGDGAAIDCMFADAPTFRDITVSKSPFAGILLTGCRDARIDGGTFRDFLSADDDVTGGFGYAVAEQGLNTGLIATGLRVTRCRHAYTTLAGSPLRWRYGMPMRTSVSGTAHDMKAAAWDTHPAGLDISFHGCASFGSRREGLQIRAKGVRVYDFLARDCQRHGILVSHSNADGALIRGADLLNTNLDPAYANNGALHVHEADGLRVQDLHVDGCNGPAVTMRSIGVLDVTLRDVSVRNACRQTTGPRAAVVLAQEAGTDRCVIDGLDVVGALDNAVAWTGTAGFAPDVRRLATRGLTGADVAGP